MSHHRPGPHPGIPTPTTSRQAGRTREASRGGRVPRPRDLDQVGQVALLLAEEQLRRSSAAYAEAEFTPYPDAFVDFAILKAVEDVEAFHHVHHAHDGDSAGGPVLRPAAAPVRAVTQRRTPAAGDDGGVVVPLEVWAGTVRVPLVGAPAHARLQTAAAFARRVSADVGPR